MILVPFAERNMVVIVGDVKDAFLRPIEIGV